MKMHETLACINNYHIFIRNNMWGLGYYNCSLHYVKVRKTQEGGVELC